MGWAVPACVVIGAISAVRIPLLVFTVGVFVAIALVAVFGLGSGRSTTDIALMAASMATLLEGGYLAGHAILHLIYGRERPRRRQPVEKIQSKFRAD